MIPPWQKRSKKEAGAKKPEASSGHCLSAFRVKTFFAPDHTIGVRRFAPGLHFARTSDPLISLLKKRPQCTTLFKARTITG